MIEAVSRRGTLPVAEGNAYLDAANVAMTNRRMPGLHYGGDATKIPQLTFGSVSTVQYQPLLRTLKYFKSIGAEAVRLTAKAHSLTLTATGSVNEATASLLREEETAEEDRAKYSVDYLLAFLDKSYNSAALKKNIYQVKISFKNDYPAKIETIFNMTAQDWMILAPRVDG